LLGDAENTRAPSEPPSTSSRMSSPSATYGAPAMAAMPGRTGLPTSTVCTLAGMRDVAAKLSASVSAARDSIRLARPSTPFCSCRITRGRRASSRVASTGATDG